MSAATKNAHGLPADPEKEGNVWCEACRQSLSASRASSHVVSKKHDDNVAKSSKGGAAPAPKKTPGSGSGSSRKASRRGGDRSDSGSDSGSGSYSGSESDDEEPLEKKGGARRKAEPSKKSTEAKPIEAKATETKAKAPAKSTHGLPRDPAKEGNFWCGICSVSLSGQKAEDHLGTARHQANEKKTLTSAMGKMRLTDK